MNTHPFQITGHTRLLAIVADPIHHVKTPQRINELLRAQGVDAVMVPMHVAAEDLTTVMNALRCMANFSGCVVTVPHKTKALALCDDVSDEARQIGAVNVVHRMPDGRLRGGMLDGIGFVEGLRGAGISPNGASVYLAGAGGAASAIAFSLAQAGVRHLTVANRSAEKAAGLIERLRHEYPALTTSVGNSDPSGHDLVVNATSLGLRPGDASPLDVSKLDPSQTVAEIIMEPAQTELLKAARARGCRVHEGAPMLASQIRLMAAFMLDQPLLARPALP
ncbi:shikimate 5-dehydrogenase [soil metagenome]